MRIHSHTPDGKSDINIRIRFAEPGDEDMITKLAIMAAGTGDPAEWGPCKRAFATPVAEAHGKVWIPYGQGECFVAEDPTDGVVGMIYSTPPVRWIRAHHPHERRIISPIMREIELLAVDERAQGKFIGSMLLVYMTGVAVLGGVHIVTAKIQQDRHRALNWWHKSDFTLLEPGEPVLIRINGISTHADDGADGHRLAVAAISQAATLKRETVNGVSRWIIDIVT